MRKSALLAGLILSTLIFINTKLSASALSLPIDINSDTNTSGSTAIALSSVESLTTEDKETTPQLQQPTKHRVLAGETLTKIASQYSTTWKRLYDKNLQIQDPNVIDLDEDLIIPATEEVLTERELPTQTTVALSETQPTSRPVAKPKTTEPTNKPIQSSKPTKRPAAGAGNGYSAGYCTWYAKSKRPDLPNNLGNANTWVSRARAQGIPTGSTPRVGAIGQQGMHVVYVEAVNNDGTVTISEMNFKGRGVISSRTVAAGTFQYIY